MVRAAPMALMGAGEFMRVLVVDDEPINRLIVTEMLASVGVASIEASDAHSALESLRRDSFAMVFIDVRMPGVDGLEATRRIRALPDERARIPIVAVTGDATDECAERARAAGADRVLHKPVKLEQLLQTVAQAIAASGKAVLA